MTPEDITGAKPKSAAQESHAVKIARLVAQIGAIDKLGAKYQDLKSRLDLLKQYEQSPENEAFIFRKIREIEAEIADWYLEKARIDKKFSAYKPVMTTTPSRVEDGINMVLKSTDPSDQDLRVGYEYDPNKHVVEAVLDRQKIIAEASRISKPRVPEEKIAKIINSLVNNGLEIEKLKKLSVMDVSNDLLEHVQGVFEDIGVVTPTVEDVEALSASCRAILAHVMTHHGANGASITKFDIKTPFIAWRVKEEIHKYLLTRPTLIPINSHGVPNEKQVKEFEENFHTTDLVLWNQDIWKAATRGAESFLGTPLTKDIIGATIPMFWQFELPMALTKEGQWKIFNLGESKYEIGGIVLMPTVDDW